MLATAIYLCLCLMPVESSPSCYWSSRTHGDSMDFVLFAMAKKLTNWTVHNTEKVRQLLII